MPAGSTYSTIATYTVTSAPSFGAITLSSIPQTYTDLILVINGSIASGSNGIRCRPNNDSSSTYSETILIGNGSSATSTRTSDNSIFYEIGILGSENSTTIIQFQNYSNTTTKKTILSRTNVAASTVRAGVYLWQSTSAISSIWLDNTVGNSNNWTTGSTLTLYGITAA